MTPRWKAVISYRSPSGSIDVTYDIEELDELARLVEQGPDWNTIEKIVVILQRVSDPNLCLEAVS